MKDSCVTISYRIEGDDNKGIYYHDTQRVLIYLNKHEGLVDIYKTINHELIHHCINICDEDLNDDQEERIIFLMSWAEEDIL